MPSSPVTPEVVRHVAALARLRVTEEELSVLTGQLARILSYIDQLKEIPPEVFPAAASPPKTPMREDAPVRGAGREALDANRAPQMHGFGAVPRVVG